MLKSPLDRPGPGVHRLTVTILVSSVPYSRLPAQHPLHSQCQHQQGSQLRTRLHVCKILCQVNSQYSINRPEQRLGQLKLLSVKIFF